MREHIETRVVEWRYALLHRHTLGWRRHQPRTARASFLAVPEPARAGIFAH